VRVLRKRDENQRMQRIKRGTPAREPQPPEAGEQHEHRSEIAGKRKNLRSADAVWIDARSRFEECDGERRIHSWNRSPIDVRPQRRRLLGLQRGIDGRYGARVDAALGEPAVPNVAICIV